MRSIVRNAAGVAILAAVGLASIPAVSLDYLNIETFRDIQKHFGEVPRFFQLFPEGDLKSMWTEYKDVHLNPETALDGKTKRLIALAVAAELDCAPCVYFQVSAAFADGASFQEVRETIAIHEIERDWSEILGGGTSDADVDHWGTAPADEVFQMVKADVDRLRAIGTLQGIRSPAAVEMN